MLRPSLVRVAALLLLGASAGLACPACEVGIGDETVRTTLSGYLWSFGFLAAAPLVIVATVLGGIARVIMAGEGREAPDTAA